MKKHLEFLGLKRNLELKSLTADEKAKIYSDFKIILKLPRGLNNYDELDDYKAFYKRCKSISKQNRQLIYYGQLFQLSIKLYFMVCEILLFNDIYEEDFNTVDFRPNKCKSSGKKGERNLEKSIADLKTVFRDRFQEICTTQLTEFNNNENKSFDKKIFDVAFKEFIHFKKNTSIKIACSSYRQSTELPSIFRRVCKNKSKI